MSTYQAAEHLGVPRQTLAQWRCAKPPKGPSFVVVGRFVKYKRADLDAWIDAQRVVTGPRPPRPPGAPYPPPQPLATASSPRPPAAPHWPSPPPAAPPLSPPHATPSPPPRLSWLPGPTASR
ncbi:MAG: helix-turn-helix domain-containing protein [Bifidobacteriaceae bacterium]|nr:helix-turn-helix domain-containing protein [Bifidobacteriaceae bacterium]